MLEKATKRRIRRAILSVLVLALIGWVVLDSPSFKACVHEAKHQGSYETFQDYISAFATAVGIHRDCLGEFVENKGEAILATFTVILAISTIMLWLATRDLFEAGERQIDIIERSTKNAEMALNQLEGPLIDISKITTELDVGANYSARRGPIVAVHFKNHGRGPASITTINCRYTFVEKLPDAPPYLKATTHSTTLILGPGQETDAPYIYELEMPAREPGTQASGMFLFFGFIEYKGIFGGTHTYAFGCAPDRKFNTFEAKGGGIYNYRKYDPA